MSGRRRASDLRSDPDLRAIHDFADLVVTSARSPVQRERLRDAAGVPVTVAGITALRTIERHGPLPVSELARRLGLDQSTASRQVRPLEEHRLVRRAAAEGDRRVAHLAITRAGRSLLQRLRDVALNDYDVALGDWSPDDRAQLASLLDRFRRDLLAIPPATGFAGVPATPRAARPRRG